VSQQTDLKAKIRDVLQQLSAEEKALFAAVYRVEQAHLHNKNVVPVTELLKKVREVIQ
jgi:hypothetical protein